MTEREALDIARTLAREEFTAEEIAAIADGPLQTELAVRTFPQGVAALVVDPLLRDALRPTVQVDDAATQQRREQAAAQIADVVVTYQRDNAIVRAGDIVERGPARRPAPAGARGGRRPGRGRQDRPAGPAGGRLVRGVPARDAAAGAAQRVAGAAAGGAAAAVHRRSWSAIQLVDIGGDARFLLIPAAAFTMLGTILFDTRVGALLIVPITALTAYVAPADGVAVPFVAMSGLACIPLVHRLAARGQLRRAAWQSTLAIVAVAGVCQVVFGDLGELVPALLAGLGNAVLVTVIVNGALPFLESVFGVLTATSLLDLADRNHPLLRELEQQALGSYNHSIMVSTLVERACRAVNADALLASVCALYHDIGKVARPYFFVENQFGITNPHDELDNPRQSAVIIKRHVTDGMEMAAVHRLPSEVVDGIRTHHGTTLVSFFYRKALQEADEHGEAPPDEEHFRYPGVKPFTRELAILMLADCCESASRAAAQQDRNLSRTALEAIVRTLIAERIEDGQLDDSPLTFADLQAVEHSFIDTLVGVYHPRIAYPDDPRRRAKELAEQARRDLADADAEATAAAAAADDVMALPAFLDPERTRPPAAVPQVPSPRARRRRCDLRPTNPLSSGCRRGPAADRNGDAGCGRVRLGRDALGARRRGAGRPVARRRAAAGRGRRGARGPPDRGARRGRGRVLGARDHDRSAARGSMDLLREASDALDLDVAEAVLEEAGQHHLDAWTPSIAHDPDAAPVLTALRDRGLKIGLLSNTHWPRAFHEHFLERDGLAPLIDVRCYTSELDWIKPHPEVFRHVAERLDVDAGALRVRGRPAAGRHQRRAGRRHEGGVAREPIAALLDRRRRRGDPRAAGAAAPRRRVARRGLRSGLRACGRPRPGAARSTRTGRRSRRGT